MRVIKGNGNLSFENARSLEKDGDLENAAALYKTLLKTSRQKLKILHRLMIISRAVKDPEKEIGYIDAAIKIHEEQYALRKSADKKITALSSQLNKVLGHVDKKGRAVLVPDELAKLQVRKERLVKKYKRK